MKTFAIAALAAVAAAQEPTAGFKDASNVWSEEDIRQYAMANFNGNEWTSLEGQLLNDEDRLEFAKNMVSKLVDAWTASLSNLPSVCAPGLTCREEKFLALLETLTEEWSKTLRSIDTQFTGGVNNANKVAEAAFREAYDCEDGCYCEEIDIVYNDILATQQ